MSRHPLLLLFIALLPAASASAQVVVESEAVGFRLLRMEASPAAESQLTFTAPPYLCAVLHLGVSSSLGTADLVDVSASWADGRFNGSNGPHFVEILEVNGSTTAAGVGTRRNISATSTAQKKLTVTEPWPTGLQSPVRYRVVKHWTIREVFGGEKLSGIANSISGTTLIDSASTWVDDEYNGSNGPHYIEITRVGASTTAPEVGMRREVVDVQATGHAIITDEPWPSSLVPPVSYRVVKHMAVHSNGRGHLNGGSLVTADSFQLWNGDSYETYYYQQQGIGGIGWRRSGDQFTNQADTPILPGQGIILSRSPSTGMILFMRGVAKTGITPLPIFPGYNFVANPYATPMTLASSGLYQANPSLGVISGSVITADQVLIWNGASYDTYYYQSAGIGGHGWRRVGDLVTDASTAVIPAASSMIIRRFAATGFEWHVPAHPTAQ